MLQSSWSAPSNIALVKYWGKKEGLQLPANPSVSLTLSKCITKAKVSLGPKSENKLTVLFEGKERPSFKPKIEKYLSHISNELSFLNDYSIKIESSNTFPHSSGIASSASSMAAISLCLVSLEKELLSLDIKNIDYNRVSSLSRIGSGSASRSLFSGAASWGEYKGIGSDDFAHQIGLHRSLNTIQNKILIIDSGVKKVSSTIGHKLMNGHQYSKSRFDQAVSNWQDSIKFLENGNWNDLGQIIEEEALALHAMMMTSHPNFILMEPNSIAAINCVREFRESSGVPIFFTLDAGPNLHLLYPFQYKKEVEHLFNDKLKTLCLDGQCIDDFVGLGPQNLTISSLTHES